MHTHTISVNGRSLPVSTPTHVDDHPSHDDWIKKNQHYIAAAANVATVIGVVLTHKPKR